MSTETERRIVGAAPIGARNTEAAGRAVREMFTSIAPRYDLVNHVVSLNTDRFWWWRAARTFDSVLTRPDARVLDLCCGTGDMTFALRRRSKNRGAWITGADFSHAMLKRAADKGSGIARLRWVEADALCLPFPSEHFDLITAAFGFRNLADYDAGLREMVRVLRPGGQCGIMDFGEPRGMIGRLYKIYFKRVLPAIGTVISGVQGPYKYLPASVERFPPPDEMLERMQQAGFREASWTPYTFGVAGLYRGSK
jgi:demethylmenaquinone methyltransferase/2-methoxy-6-polyprenyl-1,4-benzoquinol methylase